MHYSNKRVLVLILLITTGQIALPPQAQGQDSYRPVSNPISLQEILASRGGFSHWTPIAVVTDGKLRWVDQKDLGPGHSLYVLGKADLVAVDDAAEELRTWSRTHPSEKIPLSKLRSIPRDSLFLADGSPANPTGGAKPDQNDANRGLKEPVRPTPKSVPPATPPEIESPTTSQARRELPHGEHPAPAPWLAWSALFVAAIGLFWLVIKKRK